MENIETNIVKSPKWIAVISSISTGWLVFIFTTFFGLYAISTILESINVETTSGPSSIATIIIAVLSGITLGVMFGKGLYGWFSNRKKSTGIILLIILMFLVLGFIPQPFIYTM